MKKILKIFCVWVFIVSATSAKASCLIKSSNGQMAPEQNDPLFNILAQVTECPGNVQGLKQALQSAGLITKPFMVANRGIHNPKLGSFSFFEQVVGDSVQLKSPVSPGDFFFGHFTAEENGQLIADQEPTQGKLMIELIAWDSVKKLFNFYELIGTGTTGQWFFRGDSSDILKDNAQVYLNQTGPKFGSRLRCSGCHSSGGPIMKELSLPHNDWWREQRKLPFSPNTLSEEIANWVKKVGDAQEFSQSVKMGIAQLEESENYQKTKQSISLQATLRPLFCETEINLESDLAPFEQSNNLIQIPTASIVNPLLAQGSLNISSSSYKQLLQEFAMNFPEIKKRDSDHAWLVPVKGHSDLLAVQTLIKKGIVSEEFVADVLAIDFQKPLFSAKRCGLLKLVPPEGLAGFVEQLKNSDVVGAVELYENMTNPKFNKFFHQQQAKEYLNKTQFELNLLEGQRKLFQNLINSREAVFKAEISKNPRGQILEPGFRVIFPLPH